MSGTSAQARIVLAGYFLFFLPAGLLLSYLAPFLSFKGLSFHEVGMVMASLFAVKLVANPLIAWWADRSGEHRRTMSMFVWLSVGAAVALQVLDGFWGLLIAVLLLSLTRNYCQSTLEAVAAGARDAGARVSYGQIRFIGSVAVCLGVALAGGLWLNESQRTLAIPAVLVCCATGFAMLNRYARRGGLYPTPESTRPRGMSVLALSAGSAQGRFPIFLLAGATLLIGANGAFYSVGTATLEAGGVSARTIALSWIGAFAVEAIGFVVFERVRKGLGRYFIGAIGMLALLRWLLFAVAESTPVLALAFALHVASFAWFHAATVKHIHSIFGGRYAVTGQAVYIASAHGIGIAGSAYWSSALFPQFAQGVFFIPLGMTALGLSLWLIDGSSRMVKPG